METTSIGGESTRVSSVGCYKNYDHMMSGGCVSLRKNSLDPHSKVSNQKETNLLDFRSFNHSRTKVSDEVSQYLKLTKCN